MARLDAPAARYGEARHNHRTGLARRRHGSYDCKSLFPKTICDGRHHATYYASFEAKARQGSRAGGRSGRPIFDAGGRRVRSRNQRTSGGWSSAGPRTGPRRHAHRGGNLRRQLGNVLRIRQGSAELHHQRRAVCPRLRRPGLRRPGLPRLRWQGLQRLPGLPRLRRRLRWLRRLRLRRLHLRVLHRVGSLHPDLRLDPSTRAG
jgi:hypothetical protein